MDVNNMITALSAKTVDAMVNVEPYNAIAEADGLAVKIMNYWDVDKMPVFMAATPDFIAEKPGRGGDLSEGLARGRAATSRTIPNKVADAIYAFYTSKGYSMSQDTFRKAMATVDVNPGFPSDLKPYMQEQAEILLKEKKIAAIPDWAQGAAPGLHGEGAGGGVRVCRRARHWCKSRDMKQSEIISALRAHEDELRQAGIASLSVIGSVARGDDGPDSDIDVVVRLTDEARRGGFAYFGRIDRLRQRLEAILARPRRPHRRADREGAAAARDREGSRPCLLIGRCNG